MERSGDPVTLFTQTGCPDCARVRACLILSDVPFIERNVSTHPAAVQVLFATGVFATPLVLAGNEAILVGRRSELARQLGFTCRCPDGDDS